MKLKIVANLLTPTYLERKTNLTLFIVVNVASGVFIRERKLWKPCGHLHKWWRSLKMGGAFLHNISFPFFFHCFFPLLSFFSLLAIEVNHHLYYTTLQLINNKLGRKKSNPHLSLFLLSLALLCFSSFLFFLWPNHKRKWPKTVKCLETQYGLHPGDYTVISAKVPWNNSVANPCCRLACVCLCGVLTV